MGWTVLYLAFAVVALWLLGEVLLQYKARLRWRLLAFAGFLTVVVGVVVLSSVVVISLGAVLFAVGQTFVTLSYRRGFSTGWALGGKPGASRRRRGGADAASAGPALEVSDVREEGAAARPPSGQEPWAEEEFDAFGTGEHPQYRPEQPETAQSGGTGDSWDSGQYPAATTGAWPATGTGTGGYGYPRPDGQDDHAATAAFPAYGATPAPEPGWDTGGHGYGYPQAAAPPEQHGYGYPQQPAQQPAGTGYGSQGYDTSGYDTSGYDTSGYGYPQATGPGGYDTPGYGGPVAYGGPEGYDTGAWHTPASGVWVPQQRETDATDAGGAQPEQYPYEGWDQNPAGYGYGYPSDQRG